VPGDQLRLRGPAHPRHRRNRTRLLLWTAVSFVFLAMNNLSLVADMVLFPNAYLLPLRQLTALIAIGVMIYGFVFEVEK
jgi:hypothetical protein